jgi:hypothetical protein
MRFVVFGDGLADFEILSTEQLPGVVLMNAGTVWFCTVRRSVHECLHSSIEALVCEVNWLAGIEVNQPY